MEKLRNDVVTAIRGCLISTKGRVSLRELSRDYSTLIGERIPYSKFGFNRLEDFLQSEPTLFLSKDGTGEYLVSAKASEKSAHISDMVAKQKAAKKRPAPRVRFNMAPARTSRWRPRDVNPTWKKPRSVVPPRLAAVAHNQIIKQIRPNVPSKVVIPSHSTINDKPPQKISVTKNTVSNERNVTANGHYNRSNSVPNSRRAVEDTSSSGGSELLTKKRITQKINSMNVVYNSDRSEHHSEIAGTGVLTKRRITQKMEQLSLGNKENYTVVNVAEPALPSPVLPLQSSIFKTQPAVLSRNSSTSSELSIGSNYSTATNYSSASTTMVHNDVAASASAIFTPEVFVRKGDPLEDLREFSRIHNLGEAVVSTKLVKTKKNRFFTCNIKLLDKHTYNSYPKEFDNPVAAQNHCAEEALTDLMSKYTRRKSLLVSSDIDVLERIPPMLEQHHHGIWVSQIKLDYADKYSEQLPDDWLKIINTVPTVQIEKFSNDYILRHCNPGDALQKGQRRNVFDIPDVSVPSNTVQFGDDGKICAQVTCILSANEIWCREDCESYNDMMGRLEIYYTGREAALKPETIKEAGYYVAKEDDSYYRVRALKKDENCVRCFFIDYGYESVIPKEDVFQLRREFAASQAQAFVCRLVGLEDLYEISATSESLQDYAYREVTLELATDDSAADSNDKPLPVYMCDYNTGVSINQELIPILTLESASPILQPLQAVLEDTVTEVYITNIETNGDVYVQIHSPGYDILQELLSEIESQIVENKLQHVVKPVTKSESGDKIYLAQDKLKKDQHWHRVKLIDWSPNEKLAQMYFIDYGNADVISAAEETLYPLEELSEVLDQYPAQAVMVRMAGLDILPSDFKTLAEKAMPIAQPVLLKVVDANDDKVPLAEFFTRNSDDGLFCINKSISLETEMKSSSNNVRNVKSTLAQLDGTKNVPSAGTLKQPPLPSKKCLFEVRIPFAVNPYNFFVQPLKSNNELNVLMENLQERYKEIVYSPLSLEEVVPGNIYASKHEDGFWYRTSVIKVIHSGSISVFYCDFGYYANLTLQQLIPLDIEFFALPYQALKAKLSGIKPKQSKWTMADCESFKQLVEKKSLYSMLLDVEHDVLYDSDIVLKLILIDTSGAEDVYIDKLLISEGVAVKE